MNKISKLTLLAGLVCSFTAMDVCADGILKEAEWWAGPYYGAHFGAGAGRVHGRLRENTTQIQTFNSLAGVNTTVQTFISNDTGYANRLRGNATGSEADLFVGYNFHPASMPNWIYGGQLEGTIFSDIGFKSIGTRTVRQNQGQQAFLNGVLFSSSSSVANSTSTVESLDELRSIFSFIARGGMLAQPETLVYGLVGLSEGNFVVPDAQNPFGGKRNQWEEGVTAGAGVEHKFNEHWSLLMEYRYLGFGISRTRANVSSSTSQSVASSGSLQTSTFFSHFIGTSHNDLDFHMGKVGIVFRA